MYFSILISIHALVKRATHAAACQETATAISIHALVKRATININIYVFLHSYFNPRPREKGDDATLTVSASAMHFNPRPREKGDTF